MKTAVARQRKFSRSDLDNCPDCGCVTESVPGTERVLCRPCGREFLVRDRWLVRRLTDDERTWVAKGPRISFSDALEVAYYGLCKAATNYDSDKSKRTTHAYWTCWHSVGDAIRARSGYSRHGNGRFRPTNFTDCSGDEGSAYLDPEDYRGMDQDCNDGILSIKSVLGKIDGRHANVVRLILDGFSVADIAKSLKLSNKRIYQIESRAHALIRKALGVSDDRND